MGKEAGWRRLPSALPQVKAGKVKALAQTCATRSPSAPDLPTMEEAGFADFAIEGWYGIFAPAKTPRPIVDKLSRVRRPLGPARHSM